MPRSMLADLIIEKNKLFPNQSRGFGVELPADLDVDLAEIDGPEGQWVDLFEFYFDSGDVLRMAHFDMDVSWGGLVWSKSTIEPGDQDDGSDTFRVKVSNIDGTFEEELDDASNVMIGDTVRYYYVHTGYSSALMSLEYQVVSATPGDKWLDIELGIESQASDVFPSIVFSTMECQLKPHHTDICSYANSSSCDKNLFTCISLGQIAYFMGQPGIPGAVWNE